MGAGNSSRFRTKTPIFLRKITSHFARDSAVNSSLVELVNNFRLDFYYEYIGTHVYIYGTVVYLWSRVEVRLSLSLPPSHLIVREAGGCDDCDDKLSFLARYPSNSYEKEKSDDGNVEER